MPGALEGVRVIDFGHYIAGPLLGMLLADQGADVVKVDPPGGPRWDTPANATWNRGKRSILLDLASAGDLATAQKLVENADVVIENFRPGVMTRLGLGADAMTEANARVGLLLDSRVCIGRPPGRHAGLRRHRRRRRSHLPHCGPERRTSGLHCHSHCFCLCSVSIGGCSGGGPLRPGTQRGWTADRSTFV